MVYLTRFIMIQNYQQEETPGLISQFPNFQAGLDPSLPQHMDSLRKRDFSDHFSDHFHTQFSALKCVVKRILYSHTSDFYFCFLFHGIMLKNYLHFLIYDIRVVGHRFLKNHPEKPKVSLEEYYHFQHLQKIILEVINNKQQMFLIFRYHENSLISFLQASVLMLKGILIQ